MAHPQLANFHPDPPKKKKPREVQKHKKTKRIENSRIENFNLQTRAVAAESWIYELLDAVEIGR